jgi:hypothetical protein
MTRGKNGNAQNHPAKVVRDRMSMILNKGASDENTLDRYLKEHTH